MSSVTLKIIEGTPTELIAIAQSLPEGSRLRLPITIMARVPLGGVEAVLGSEPVRIVDATSMGTVFFQNLELGKTHWLDGFWGDFFEPAASKTSPVFRVTRVGPEVEAGTPLTLFCSNAFR